MLQTNSHKDSIQIITIIIRKDNTPYEKTPINSIIPVIITSSLVVTWLIGLPKYSTISFAFL